MNLLSSLLKYTADQIAALRAKDTSQDTTVSGINSRLTTAEGDIDSLEAQFTTVVSAVTTDTEVTNIRVGDDGVTYDTAGIAVRTQFADVRNDLAESTNNLFNLDLLKGDGLTRSGDTVSGTARKFYEATGSGSGSDFGITFEADTNYIIEFDAKTDGATSTGDGLKVRIIYTDSTTADLTIANNKTSFGHYDIRTSSDKVVSKIAFAYGSGQNNNWDVKNFQITKGNMLSDYIPHWSAVDVINRLKLDAVYGTTRNIFDEEFTLGAINTSTGALTESYTQLRSKNKIPVIASKAYHIAIPQGTFIAYFYTSSDTFIERTSWSAEIDVVAPSTAAYMRLALDSTYGKVYHHDIYISLSDEQVGYIPHFTAEDFTAREKADAVIGQNNSFKLCTFNVGKWGNGVNQGCPDSDVATMIPKWLQFIGKSDFDIMCCNEFREYFDASSSILPFNRFFKTSFLALNESESSNEEKMLNKIPVKWDGYISLNLNSGAQHFSVYVGGKRVQIYFMHLSTEEALDGRRSADIGRLVNLLTGKEHCIVCGDFNVREFSEFNAFSGFNMANGGNFGKFKTLVDGTSSGYTNRCVDNIICTPDIEISYVETYTEDQLSDHYPLIARLLVK